MFVKRNPIPGSDSLQCEAKGLELLRNHASAHGLRIPSVISVDANELKVEKIAAESPPRGAFVSFGERLARLHHVKRPAFGLEYPNYIGLNRQINDPMQDWGEFFVNRRLEYQIGLIESEKVKDRLSRTLESARSRLIDFLNAHRPAPSLLHGDLWSGNFLYSKGDFWLIDPAVYFGDRECDLAMTQMFGGFPEEFYENYKKFFSLPSGFELRFRVYNSYHYLNHYNLFGDSYLHGVVEAFESFNEL